MRHIVSARILFPEYSREALDQATELNLLSRRIERRPCFCSRPARFLDRSGEGSEEFIGTVNSYKTRHDKNVRPGVSFCLATSNTSE
jgi:hypothetical protein